jgi:hypothetical protein
MHRLKDSFRKYSPLNEQRLVSCRAKVVVTIHIVAPPGGEVHSRTAGTEDGEGQNEQHRETGTIKGASDQVRVVLEDSGSVVPEIELNEEPSNDLAEDDTGLRLVVRDVAGVLDELGHVDLIEAETLDLGDKLRALGVRGEETK